MIINTTKELRELENIFDYVENKQLQIKGMITGTIYDVVICKDKSFIKKMLNKYNHKVSDLEDQFSRLYFTVMMPEKKVSIIYLSRYIRNMKGTNDILKSSIGHTLFETELSDNSTEQKEDNIYKCMDVISNTEVSHVLDIYCTCLESHLVYKGMNDKDIFSTIRLDRRRFKKLINNACGVQKNGNLRRTDVNDIRRKENDG